MRAVPSLSLLAATLLLGCGSDGGMDPGDGPGPPASVSVTPSSRTVELPGGTVSFTATARDAEGGVVSSASFTWTNSDADVAVAGGGGAVETVGPGVATITATTGSVSGAATVTVTGEAGSEVMRALTRLRPDGRSWIYARSDGSRRRMQGFWGELVEGANRAVAETEDSDARVVLDRITENGPRLRLQEPDGSD
jgi:hypothetical protein